VVLFRSIPRRPVTKDVELEQETRKEEGRKARHPGRSTHGRNKRDVTVPIV
jgi:hypothetical protein